jgi:D-alanyl-D-alanine carboxypeptidase
MRRLSIATLAFLLLAIATVPAYAASKAAKADPLTAVYLKRQDLQALFDPRTFAAVPQAATSLVNLKDWAKQTGWREEKSLKSYAPKIAAPRLRANASPAPEVATAAYVVIDRKTGLILAQKEASTPRRIASLTKLATAAVVLGKKIPVGKIQPITAADKVGGSALNAKDGSRFTVNDLFYAVFLASANDAANALAGATKLTREKFVAAMNNQAKDLGLGRTVFADPTGINDGNISTPREFALLADYAFGLPAVRKYSLTAKRTLRIVGTKKYFTVKNTNAMLWKPEFDDIIVTGGKTGYLGADGGWNLAVGLRDAKDKKRPEILLILFGNETLKQEEADAEALARWAWENHEWKLVK